LWLLTAFLELQLNIQWEAMSMTYRKHSPYKQN